MLRRSGKRQVAGRSARTEDFTQAKAARVAEGEAIERGRAAALAELARHRGELERLKVSDEARDELLSLYAVCLSQVSGHRDDVESQVEIPLHQAVLVVASTPGRGTTIVSPSERLRLVDRSLRIESRGAQHGGAQQGAQHGGARHAAAATREVARAEGAVS